MKEDHQTERYIFTTQGVCPPEIHFKIQNDILKELRFVGGGCPGNAQLVMRLLQGKPIHEVLELVRDIDCRNGTSCPDQLAKAIRSASEGILEPARSFRIHADSKPRDRLALIGDMGGRKNSLQRLIQDIREKRLETIYCLGNLTRDAFNNKELLALIRKEGVLAIQGELDSQYGQGDEPSGYPPLEQKERDYLFSLPHVLTFQLGEKIGMAFFGQYLHNLPGYSDFEPFALEMNMVCDLTNFLRDESVFPALEAMVPQFEAQITLFSQIRKWGHWTIGGIEFISVGPALSHNELTWGLLESTDGGIDFSVIRVG